ncbi:MAG: TetR/AcrR family transcriptional regulator [Nitriliruptor sp.]|uniref:TetR/AcrR family transcriptional regulator n=1 Tax=Nitriliruptor sp. TaxID=2448056 RepID=UPI0034A04360
MRRDEQRERTKGELLDAAATIFAEQGFHGASVDQIAEAAGYTKGAVYSNFDSKEELFLQLLDRELDRTVEVLTELVERVPAAERAAALTAQAGDLEVLGGRWFLLEAEFLLYAARAEDERVRRRVADRQQRTRTRITALIRQHLDDVGTDAAVAAEDIARLLMAAADGLTQAALVDERARDGGRLFGLLVTILLGSLPPAGRRP